MTRVDFNKLVHSLGKSLYGYAYRILKDQQGAEDAVQEIFVKLWKMNERLEEYNSIDALATTMIKNHCIDQIRKQKYYGPDVIDLINNHLDKDPTPYEKLERSENYFIIKKIIGNLPEMFRRVIQLRDIEGFSYEEIASKTGQNINTLRVNLSRARRIVKDEYEKYNNEFKGSKNSAGKVL